jgi:hypothetical protein
MPKKELKKKGEKLEKTERKHKKLKIIGNPLGGKNSEKGEKYRE